MIYEVIDQTGEVRGRFNSLDEALAFISKHPNWRIDNSKSTKLSLPQKATVEVNEDDMRKLNSPVMNLSPPTIKVGNREVLATDLNIELAMKVADADERVHNGYGQRLMFNTFIGGPLVTGAVLTPLSFGASATLPWFSTYAMPYVNGAMNAYGAYLLASKDGVRKTWNLIKEGDYEGATYSGLGDAMNAAFMFPFLKQFKLFKRGKSTENLNWNAEDYFKNTRSDKIFDLEDIDIFNSHIPEYKAIEQKTKKNGTFLKMPDGSLWKGDPRAWIQLQSKNAKLYNKEVFYHGDDAVYVNNIGENITPQLLSNKVLWGSTNPRVARSYTNSDFRLSPFIIEDKPPLKVLNAEGRNWRAISTKMGKPYSTNDFSWEYLTPDEYLRINNVVDPSNNTILPKTSLYYTEVNNNTPYFDWIDKNFVGDDIVIGTNVKRKFVSGNNGDFNPNINNVYKVLLPFGIGLGTLNFNKNNNGKDE